MKASSLAADIRAALQSTRLKEMDQGERICIAHGLQNIASAGKGFIPHALSGYGTQHLSSLVHIGLLAKTEGGGYQFIGTEQARSMILDAKIDADGLMRLTE